MKLNYVVAAIFGFMLLHLWIIHTELDRRYMNHLHVERVVFKAQNEVFSVHAEAINKQTELLRKVLESLPTKVDI